MVLKNDKSKIHDILYNRAQLYYELEQYNEADEDYRLMLKHNEADQVAMIGLVRNMIARKEYAEAVEMASWSENIDSGMDIEKLNLCGYIQYRLELFAKCGCGTPRISEVTIDFK